MTYEDYKGYLETLIEENDIQCSERLIERLARSATAIQSETDFSVDDNIEELQTHLSKKQIESEEWEYILEDFATYIADEQEIYFEDDTADE